MSLLVHPQLVAYKLGMAGDADDKVGMVIVCLDDGVGRAVLPQFLMNGGETGSSSLRQTQFFEELAQAGISVTTSMNALAGPKVV